DIEVQEVSSCFHLPSNELTQVIHSCRYTGFLSRHGGLNRDFDVLDSALFIILGAFGFLWNSEISTLTASVGIANGLFPARACAYQLPVSKHDSSRVNIFANDYEFLVQTRQSHPVFSSI